MKRFWLILGVLVIAALIVEEVYDFFVTNQGVEYFSSRPLRLLYLAGIAVIAGLVTVSYGRLSVGWQRTARLSVLAAVATALTAFCCYMSLAAVHVLGEPFFASSRWLVVGCCFLFLGLAVWMWFEFWHLLRRGSTRFL